MEFCPKCGKLLMPEKKDEKIFLVCKSCGYQKSTAETKGYKIVQPVDESKRRTTLIVEASQVKGKRRKEEEHELIADNYDLYSESMLEEEEERESEESDFE
ncbi:MAG: hypothetical protein WHS82_07835 [Candidatus Methanosuratincola sp.]